MTITFTEEQFYKIMEMAAEDQRKILEEATRIEEEKARIRREMLSRAAEASTNLEYGGEE